MKIEDILKQLQAIQANPDYILRSKREILGAHEVNLSLSPWQVFLRSLQFSSAVALASLLLIVTVGGLSAWKFISPFQLSSLDPIGLQAEAEAIDIQIELANVAYSSPEHKLLQKSDKKASLKASLVEEKDIEKNESSTAINIVPEIGLNDALELLSE